ncbi:MAG: transcriptional regulator [Desulfobacula sp.]|jgi:HTH-type transcriptional regulator / antitoxin HigA|uniref:helix-turn-helix domain-containing protein n=1 Tax=Desulfobacula sp. TaxID=2593537 RepID=UPI001DDD242F|nr:transcriptional regulator [Desulfobacula sp.]MBT3485908.1 transcriptional regulator [Desulfobacula sp.]MBT3805447.1 transcriptional regulator [Desulfobacula sp.]MBT4025984.1 transcriptional regulator [Desulfobacula sp.]MBT4199097.1 transcriptional regulator [Desulfobacula sp.]
MNTQIKEVAKVWPKIQDVFTIPHNDKEYKKLVSFLDSIIDEVGEDEKHPLASLMETLGSLVEIYESQNVPEFHVDPISMLRILMSEHGLKQLDMKEIGSQGVVSEVLSGKRSLNSRQIKALSEKFGVSPAVFI